MSFELDDNDRWDQVTTAAGQTVLHGDFPIFDSAKIGVTRTRAGANVLLDLGDDFTVSNVGLASGFDVTLVVPALADDIYTLDGRTTVESVAGRFSTQGNFDASGVNRAYDILRMAMQERARDLSRTMRVPITDILSELPNKAARQNGGHGGVLVFDGVTGDIRLSTVTAEGLEAGFGDVSELLAARDEAVEAASEASDDRDEAVAANEAAQAAAAALLNAPIAASADNFAALAALALSPASAGKYALLKGYWTGDDTGGGLFKINYIVPPGALPANDGGTIIRSTATPGIYLTRVKGSTTTYPAEWFGGQDAGGDFSLSTIAAHNIAAFNAAIAAAPLGGTVTWGSGCFLIEQPLSITRRVGFVCLTSGDYIMPHVVSTQDGFTLTGQLDDCDYVINMCGMSAVCRDGVVFDRAMSPRRIHVRVQTNVTRYGCRVTGCENIKDFRYYSTTNYLDYPHQSNPQVTHLRIEDYASSIGANANKFFVDIAGGNNALSINNGVSDGGDVQITGTIQGVGGSPITASGCTNLKIYDMHVEASTGQLNFSNCTNLILENFFCYLQQINITGCWFYRCENVSGFLNIDATSKQGSDNRTRCGATDSLIALPTSHDTLVGAVKNNQANLLLGGGGYGPQKSRADNAYMATWSGGVPSAWGGSNVTWTQVTDLANCYPDNPTGNFARALMSTTALADGPTYTPSGQYVLRQDTWISFLIAILPDAANVPVYFYDGTQYINCKTVIANSNWTIVRASILVPANGAWKIAPRTATANVRFHIGGLAWAPGQICNKYL